MAASLRRDHFIGRNFWQQKIEWLILKTRI
jgi:membrane-associated PAP2 superfamily phosphatase